MAARSLFNLRILDNGIVICKIHQQLGVERGVGKYAFPIGNRKASVYSVSSSHCYSQRGLYKKQPGSDRLVSGVDMCHVHVQEVGGGGLAYINNERSCEME